MISKVCDVCGAEVKAVSDNQIHNSMKHHRKSKRHQIGEEIRKKIERGEMPTTEKLDSGKN